jgi:protein-tyrosine phosphatase
MPTVLTVCTGNICRSPAAAVLLQQHLGEHATVLGAGVTAMVGWDIDPPMRGLLESDGVEVHRHAGQQLTPTLLSDADLVVAMTSAHRRAAVELDPTAAPRIFLLRQLEAAARAGVALQGSDLESRLECLPEAMSGAKTVNWDAGDLDVPDPYGRPRHEYEENYRSIRESTLTVAAWLMGRSRAEPHHAD